MKEIKTFLSALLMAIILTSCEYNRINIAGITKHKTTYTSWIVIDGLAYQAELTYPKGKVTELESIYVNKAPVYMENYTISETIISDEVSDRVHITTKEIEYIFDYGEFSIPVSYTVQEAYVVSYDVVINLPSLNPKEAELQKENGLTYFFENNYYIAYGQISGDDWSSKTTITIRLN